MTETSEPITLQVHPQSLHETTGLSERVFGEDGKRMVQNVSQPTLTAYLPDPDKATGAAVIVAPGGGFMVLSIETEGSLVAERLADLGIAAFVLKYRLEETPEDLALLQATAIERLTENVARRKAATTERPFVSAFPAQALAERDAQEALRLVRARAAEWGIDAGRVGLLGFSAGGMIATDVATAESAPRPDFIGVIYGGLDRAVPADAPPAFIMTASDDPLCGPEAVAGIYHAWRAAGASAELHLYERGGHGFGIVPQGASSDRWFEQFVWWLESRKIIESRAA